MNKAQEPQVARRNDAIRQPGRSFDDPSKPLGTELLDGSTDDNVADRAKVVGVLAKAEELMATANPPPDDFRRALELACGRVGVHLDEYDAIVSRDEECALLEKRVLDAAQIRGRMETGPSNLSQQPLKS